MAELVKAGRITPEEARSHPRRNVITRSLGEGRYLELSRIDWQLQSQDKMLLCSDGLHGVVNDPEIIDLMYQADHPESACTSLISSALARGSTDNITAVVVFIEKEC